MRPRRILLISFFTLCGLLLTWLSGLAASQYKHPFHQNTAEPPTPSPTYDPLATPVLPDHPTQFDQGRFSYYFHCMPCHGDVGQGLTDAWRMVWEEDHRNCWGRGCHGGRPKDEGFPIPTVVPAVIAPDDLLDKYPDLEALVSYLHDTHPPQRPGKLKDDEYRTMAVFLWVSNNRPLPTNNGLPMLVRPSPIPTNTPPSPSPSFTRPFPLTASPSPVNASTSLPPQNPATTRLDARLLSLAVVVCLVLMILILIIKKRSRR